MLQALDNLHTLLERIEDGTFAEQQLQQGVTITSISARYAKLAQALPLLTYIEQYVPACFLHASPSTSL